MKFAALLVLAATALTSVTAASNDVVFDLDRSIGRPSKVKAAAAAASKKTSSKKTSKKHPSTRIERLNALLQFQQVTVGLQLGAQAAKHAAVVAFSSGAIFAGSTSNPYTDSKTRKLIAPEDGDNPAIYSDAVRIGSAKIYNYSPILDTSEYDGPSYSPLFGGDSQLSLGPSFGDDDPSLDASSNFNSLTDRLYSAKLIPRSAVTISLPVAVNATNAQPGRLILGSPSKADHCSDFEYTKQDPTVKVDSEFGYPTWQFQANYKYGGKSLPVLNGTAVSKTAPVTLEPYYAPIFLPTSVFAALQQATNLTASETMPGFYFVPQESVRKLKDFTVVVDGKSYTLSPSAQLIPDALSAAYMPASVGVGSVFTPINSYTRSADVSPYSIFGLTWFERYTTTVETLDKSRGRKGRIGFAQTSVRLPCSRDSDARQWTFAHTSANATASKVKPAKGCKVHKV